MAINISHRVCNGHLLKWITAAGLEWLDYNREKVDQLNVFPVPDGDTGKNMLLTMRSAYQEVSGLNEEHVGIVSEAIAHGALMGARGNSGVILSQLWKGFAQALRGHEVFDGPLFAHACSLAVDAAYKAVIEPVEGTILTVAREAAEAVNERAKHESELRVLLDVMIKAAHESLLRTPDLLPVLKKAGVVDSGGQGLIYILEGMQHFLRGNSVLDPDERPEAAKLSASWEEALEPDDDEGYGYDVQFLMHGSNLDVELVRTAINNMGWSTLVVGDEQLIKVHVHVHDPGQPISYAIHLGAVLDDIVVENMQQQYQEFVKERHAREEETEQSHVNAVAVVTVANGDGIQRLLKQDLQAAVVISGGQTMNPSTQDFLLAIDALPNTKIVLLPNNKNIILAAQQAATLAKDKEVIVVPSRTLPQGISAMLAYTNIAHSDNLSEVGEMMEEALHFVTSCEVTIATRDVEIDGVMVREGQYIGLIDGNLTAASNDLTALVSDVLQQAGANEREIITLYYGANIRQAQAQALVEALSQEFAGQTFEIMRGDQPLYQYIISVE